MNIVDDRTGHYLASEDLYAIVEPEGDQLWMRIATNREADAERLLAEFPGCRLLKPGEWQYPPLVRIRRAERSKAARKVIAETNAQIQNLIDMRRRIL